MRRWMQVRCRLVTTSLSARPITLLVAVLAAALATVPTTTPTTPTAPPAPFWTTAASSAVTPCSSGLVALTFDDGPDRDLTPRLVGILDRRGVPATFFVNGGDVRAAPGVVRGASARGFTIANHTFGHERLTRLTDRAIRDTMARTRRSILETGARASKLMRPPYGLIDNRVRAVVEGAGYVPVMWTVDPRDWERHGPDTIARRVLSQLRPHRRNVVLQHDGIGNSANSVAAVPRIIRDARARGYCFAALGVHGRPVPPVPRILVQNAGGTEGPAGSASFLLRLDRPTSRLTSVLVTTIGGTARSGADFRRVRHRVRFPVGSRRATVVVRLVDDNVDEIRESFGLRLSNPRGIKIARARARGVLRDNDPLPRLSLRDTSLKEPAQGAADAKVVVRLREPSGRTVSVALQTEPASADEKDYRPVAVVARIPAGRLTATVAVPVLADQVEEASEHLLIRATTVRNARSVRATATVTILPPAA